MFEIKKFLDPFVIFYGSMDVLLIRVYSGYDEKLIEEAKDEFAYQCRARLIEKFNREQTDRIVAKIKEVLREACRDAWNCYACQFLIERIGLDEFKSFASDCSMQAVEIEGKHVAVPASLVIEEGIDILSFATEEEIGAAHKN